MKSTKTLVKSTFFIVKSAFFIVKSTKIIVKIDPDSSFDNLLRYEIWTNSRHIVQSNSYCNDHFYGTTSFFISSPIIPNAFGIVHFDSSNH